ncbi:MAG: MFS transporter [Kiritimatiellae bacterium]|nr:MFS transporter [Kiritimatiellia bacterium]
MIFDRPLTAEERRVSVRRLALYNLLNGGSYVCVGETVMVLVAVRLGCPDAVSAAIGTMLYVGFAALPLGRFAAARIGAARAAGGFWVLRNAFALLLPAAALWGPRHPVLVAATVLFASFGFYACRAAGVVLHVPIVGDATAEEERGAVLGRLGALFYLGMCTGMAGVLWALHRSDSFGTLAAVVAAGSALGVWASWFLARVHETAALREGARKPVLADLREIAANRAFMRHVLACCCLNLAAMLVQPASVIVLKRGYGATDLQAMLFAASSSVASAVGSALNGPLARRFGPRREMVAAYLGLLAVALFWMLLPAASAASAGAGMAALWAAGFFLLGAARVVMDNAIGHYSISVVEPRLRVSASAILYTAMGALAGLVGLAAASILMFVASSGGATDAPGPAAIAAYRSYFLSVFVLLAPLAVFLFRVIPLPADVRARLHRNHVQH